jgi:uncharacterized protein (TIGR02594 family)
MAPRNQPIPSDNQLIVTAEGLNVRDTPNLQGQVLDVLSKNEIVTWLDSSGDDYWRKIQHDETIGWASHKYLQPVLNQPPSSNYPWVEIAYREIGVHEVVGRGDNPRVLEYLRSTNLDAPSASTDETYWCSAFVNWCVEQAGYAGTDSAWARSWLNWGRNTSAPALGTVAVFSRGSGGHVAFYISRTASGIKVLGGNQSNQVCIATYPASRLLGFRNPA